MKILKKKLDVKNLNQFLAAIPYAKYIDISVDSISLTDVILIANINKWNLESSIDNDINNSFMYGAIDTAAYLAILNRVGKFKSAVTLSLKINHLSKKNSREGIYFKAQCVELKKQYAYSFVKVFQSGEKIIANANAIFLFNHLSK
ncbi:MAG: hypothetical protein CFH01_01994 [Alphaproteobacteria bacterium MarineAlpha2_Bin1]|nr:MAG: hypothetical protein CFH01_01994 [Alphaproteobacteria bacterium MarineAlpha2_Bin1]|tara:strand:- start:1366 stop:1803 length:438 start_codon:yes stop_codon:yes gene_type:complete